MVSCSICGADINTADLFCKKCGSRCSSHEAQNPANEYQETLLIEWIAGRSGVTRLTNLMNIPVYAPYLLVGIGIFAAFGLLPIYSYITTGFHSALVNPLRPILISVGLIFSVASIRYMTTEYAQTINRLDFSHRQTTVESQFQSIVSLRSKILVFGSIIIVYYLSVLVPSIIQAVGINIESGLLTALSGRDIQTLIEAEGVITTIVGQLIVVPLINIPVVLEFAILFFGIHVVLPNRIFQADFKLFFHDPRDMGGLSDIGQLLKQSYYLYTGGVLLYFAVAYGPVVFSQLVTTPQPTPGIDVVALFSLVWIIGLGLVTYSFYTIHRIMRSKKDRRLKEIESDMKALIENPFEIRSSRVADTEAMGTKQRQLKQVKSTRTYPATFSMWWQLGLSVLLPQALQLAVQAIM